MDKSVPRVTVWYHSAGPCDAKTITLGTDLSFRTWNSCQILILYAILSGYNQVDIWHEVGAESVIIL